MQFDAKQLDWPKEYAKPILVVPDIMVDSMREAFGDAVRVVAITDTMLPLTDNPGEKP